jgi:cation diffusion facilitator family transporter
MTGERPERNDPHGHGHGHGHGRSGPVGAVVGRCRRHSHGAADSLDTTLEASTDGLRAVKISFVALVITALAQVAVLWATGSVALLADTVHNFSDALTAVPLFMAFRLSRRPPTRRYTYGFRRAEDLAGVLVIAMITVSAGIAAWAAVDRLIHPRPLDNIGWLFAAGVIGFAGNELAAVYRISVGRRIGSAALEADGHHARTDGFTSLAVALGAAATWVGFERADPIVGLVISIAIFAVLRGAARRVFHRLMDAVDSDIIASIEHIAAHVDGVQRVGAVRARWVGHRLATSIAVVVNDDLTVRQGHDVAEDVRHDLLHNVRHLDDIDVHVDPVARDGRDPHARVARTAVAEARHAPMT